MPLVAVAAIGAASGIGQGLIGAHAAGKAADAQVNAANHAADLQKQAADESLAFQKQQYNTNQQQMQPWLSAGKGALTNLQYLLGIPNAPQQGQQGPSPYTGGTYQDQTNNQRLGFGGNDNTMMRRNTYQGGSRMAFDGMDPYSGPGARGAQDLPATRMSDGGPQTPTSATVGGPDPQLNTNLGNFGQLLQPWTEQFKAPDAITEQNDPGYQARLKLGQDTIEKSAAARGGVLTGGTAKDLTNYAQDYASNEYGNVYARGWNDYTSRYNNFQTNNANTFNRLAAISGVGQTTADQLGMMGLNSANGINSTLMNSAAQIGQQYNNAGAARASGYVGQANAINGGIGSVNSALQNYLLLQQLSKPSGAQTTAKSSVRG
jgi:predicted flap endonuclease-1-like 5' DNA nuclease